MYSSSPSLNMSRNYKIEAKILSTSGNLQALESMETPLLKVSSFTTCRH